MAKPTPTCPICQSASAEVLRPFCSRRCADVDLARWLGGVYAVPIVDHDDDEDGMGLSRADEGATIRQKTEH